jgi:hypothetical protein
VIVGGVLGGIPGSVVAGTGAIILDISAKDAIVERCRIFAAESSVKLKQAVDEVNSYSGSSVSRITLAIPKFSKENSIFASDSWLFGINSDLSPEDSVARARAVECERAGSSRTDSLTCKVASVGHPNTKGEKEYARVIINIS